MRLQIISHARGKSLFGQLLVSSRLWCVHVELSGSEVTSGVRSCPLGVRCEEEMSNVRHWVMHVLSH
jgi:hypothetical protein